MQLKVCWKGTRDWKGWGPYGEHSKAIAIAENKIREAVKDIPNDVELEIHSVPLSYPINFDNIDGYCWGWIDIIDEEIK